MPILSTRLFQCLRCRRQVMVCQQCDHGQRYCAEGCRQAARKSTRQRANKKYQNSRQGRFNNAARQKRFRQRQKEKANKVTYQGSPASPPNVPLIEKLCPRQNGEKVQQKPIETVCHFCGCPSGRYFRGGFLKKRTTYPYQSKKSAGESHNDH